jgi:hypothetical protein
MTMRRGTFVIILFVLVAGAIIAATTLLRSQPALEITIATDPLAREWVQAAALSYNESGATVGVGRRVRVLVTARSDTQVLQTPWAPNDQPVGWIPAWSSLAAVSRGSTVTTQTVALSLARTPLIWMSYANRDADIPDVTWQGIQEVADSENIDLAFSLPPQSVQGLASLISAVADFHQTGILSDSMLSDSGMRNWLLPLVESVPNFNTLGPNVALYVAGPQGGTVDAAIAPESQWLSALNTLTAKGQPRFAYPAFPVIFDFPFITLRDIATTDDEISAAQSFAAYLSSAEQQQNLERYGLRPAQSDPQPTSTVFGTAQQYGITATLPSSQPVQLPSSSSVLSLLTWFNSANR